MKKEKQGFQVNFRRPTAVASMLAFAFCIPTQIMGYKDQLHDPIIAVTLVAFPVLSALMMIAVILALGRTALRLSVFPVCLGVLGFVFKLMLDPRAVSFWHHFSAALLYILIITLWALTVFYVIRTKWILAIFFLIPFFKHIFINDIPVLIGTADAVSLSTWMKECSMLSFMLALFFFAVSFEKTEL